MDTSDILDSILDLARKYRDEFATFDGFSEDVKEAYFQVAEELELLVEEAANIK